MAMIPPSFKTRRISPYIYGVRVMRGFDNTSAHPRVSHDEAGGTPINGKYLVQMLDNHDALQPKSRICQMITYQSIALTFRGLAVFKKTACLLLWAKSLLRPPRTIKIPAIPYDYLLRIS